LAAKKKNNMNCAKIDVDAGNGDGFDRSGEGFLDFRKGLKVFVGKHLNCGVDCRHLGGYYEGLGLVLGRGGGRGYCKKERKALLNKSGVVLPRLPVFEDHGRNTEPKQ
jgi:hypothetical protein